MVMYMQMTCRRFHICDKSYIHAEFLDLNRESDEELFRPRRNRVLPIPSSSDSEGSNDEVLDWSTTDNVPIIEQFQGQSGVFVMQDNSESVIDEVKLFIGDDLFQYMATETNRYHERNPDAFRERAKSVKWKDVNVVDLKKSARTTSSNGTSL